MNLFDFGPSEGEAEGFQISKQFWIFVILTVPLTLITIGSWMVLERKRKEQKKTSRKMLALNTEEKEEV